MEKQLPVKTYLANILLEPPHPSKIHYKYYIEKTVIVKGLTGKNVS